jgi:hypothetical protein
MQPITRGHIVGIAYRWMWRRWCEKKAAPIPARRVLGKAGVHRDERTVIEYFANREKTLAKNKLTQLSSA